VNGILSVSVSQAISAAISAEREACAAGERSVLFGCFFPSWSSESKQGFVVLADDACKARGPHAALAPSRHPSLAQEVRNKPTLGAVNI